MTNSLKSKPFKPQLNLFLYYQIKFSSMHVSGGKVLPDANIMLCPGSDNKSNTVGMNPGIIPEQDLPE